VSQTAAPSSTATARIAAWAVGTAFEQIPEDAVRLAGTAVLDCVGVTLAGSRAEPATRVRELVETLGGEPQAAVLGTAVRTSTLLAALANGTAAHALDFDDTNHPGYAHPSAALVPSLLALAEWNGGSGRDLLTAYLTGFEVEVRVARAVNMPHYVAGWHATATLGTLGAAAAAARLLGLEPDEATRALSIAASLAGGLRENFGTDTKPLHAGLAAKNGVLAALLARGGFTAADDGLGGRYGFCSVLDGGGEARLEELDPSRFGRPWEITEPYGLAIKQFPACGATHPALEAALALATELQPRPEQIARVRVGTSELAPKIVVYDRPRTGLEGKFSLEYCVAAAFLDRRVGLEHFEDEAVARPDIQTLLPKISAEIDERVRTSPEFAAIVELELADGTRREERVDLARGKTSRPLSREELVAKYRDCASRALPTGAVEESLALLEALDELESVGRLVRCLVPS
jgi:2-methylcitrate dehydratase PrpD